MLLLLCIWTLLLNTHKLQYDIILVWSYHRAHVRDELRDEAIGDVARLRSAPRPRGRRLKGAEITLSRKFPEDSEYFRRFSRDQNKFPVGPLAKTAVSCFLPQISVEHRSPYNVCSYSLTRVRRNSLKTITYFNYCMATSLTATWKSLACNIEQLVIVMYIAIVIVIVIATNACKVTRVALRPAGRGLLRLFDTASLPSQLEKLYSKHLRHRSRSHNQQLFETEQKRIQQV